MSQLEIAELFGTTKQHVSLHINNVLAEAELAAEATVKESLTVQREGSRDVERKTLFYRAIGAAGSFFHATDFFEHGAA